MKAFSPYDVPTEKISDSPSVRDSFQDHAKAVTPARAVMFHKERGPASAFEPHPSSVPATAQTESEICVIPARQNRNGPCLSGGPSSRDGSVLSSTTNRHGVCGLSYHVINKPRID